MEPRGGVLIVEDDLDTCELLAQVLEDSGYEVSAMGEGQEALDHLHQGFRPCVVLLDLLMPGVNGVEFLRRLRADPDPEVARTPVVVMTGLVTAQALLNGLAPTDLLLKPFTVRDLYRAIEPFCGARPLEIGA